MLRKILISIVALFLSCSSVSAKMIIKDYATHKYWKIYSSHEKGKRLAEHCTILSRGNPFSLNYDANYGWYIYFIIRGKSKLPNKLKVVKFYIDKKFIGEKTGIISSKTRGVFIPLGLDTTILNPIFEGNVLNILVGKIRIAVGLGGIKRAYHKALGCWRERMDSVPYVANKTRKERQKKQVQNQKQKARHSSDDLLQLKLNMKTYLVAMGLNANFDAFKFYSKLDESIKNDKRISKSNLFLLNLGSEQEYPIGEVLVIPADSGRLPLKGVNELLDSFIAKSMSDCKKTAVEKVTPYFIGQAAEVHIRAMFCLEEKGHSFDGRIWLIQTDKYILTGSMFLPKEKAELMSEQMFKNVIEDVATGLVK